MPHILTFSAAFAACPARVGSKFAAVAYSGARIESWNAIIDLASTRIEESMPVLMSHDRERVIGVVETTENDGAAVRIAGRLHSDIDEQASQIVAKARAGQRWQMSVGLWNATERTVPAGKSEVVNGRKILGPVAVLAGGLIREASIVPLGADPATGATFFAAGGRLAREEVSPLVADAMHRAALAAAASGAWR